MITTGEKLACAERELMMRRHAYPRFVEQQKMTKAKAEREIELMESIVDDYKAQLDRERPQLPL